MFQDPNVADKIYDELAFEMGWGDVRKDVHRFDLGWPEAEEVEDIGTEIEQGPELLLNILFLPRSRYMDSRRRSFRLQTAYPSL